MLSILKIPVLWIMIYAVIMCAVSLSFLDPTLADHLESVLLFLFHQNFMQIMSAKLFEYMQRIIFIPMINYILYLKN